MKVYADLQEIVRGLRLGSVLGSMHFAVLSGCFVVQCSIALRIEAGEGDEDEQNGSGSGPFSPNLRGSSELTSERFSKPLRTKLLEVLCPPRKGLRAPRLAFWAVSATETSHKLNVP